MRVRVQFRVPERRSLGTRLGYFGWHAWTASSVSTHIFAIVMSYPQKPETWKVTATGEGCSIRFGVSAMQGWRREMRDAHVCNLNNFSFAGWGFFGVFDGHFSPKVSQYCSQNLLDCIVESTELDSDCELSADAVKDGIYKGFLKIDHRLKNLPQWANGEDRGGTTATVVFVSPKEIIWGNCGNTRGLLCRNGKVVFATEEHLPFNEKEKSRIEKAGGTVRMQRINGTLGFSRALGDFYFKCAAELPATEQLVSPEPELTIQEREPSTDEFLFLACKGVFGYMTNEEVIAYIRHKLELTDDLSEICSDLIDLCLNKVCVLYPQICTHHVKYCLLIFAELQRQHDCYSCYLPKCT